MTISIDEFKKVDLRIGKILEVNPHPNADKLYCLSVDVGDQKKTLVAGIRAQYKPEELVGRLVVVVNNLQPVTLRGVESQGMVLAASDGQALSIISPEKEISPGSTIK